MTQEQVQTSPLERRIDMTVAMATIDVEVEKRLKQMSKTVKMAGFRPGKVPFKIVAQNYGYQARSEAIGAAVEKAFGEEAQKQNLKVAGYPRFEPKNPDNAEANREKLEFTAVFEVFPEIVLADLSATEVEKVSFTVTDAEVDKTIDALRKQRVGYESTDRASQKEDRVTIDFLGRLDGVEFDGGKGADYPVVVGGGQMLPDFDKGLEGMKAGETKTIDVAFPEGYQAPNLAGKTAQFDLTCKKVEAPVLPIVDAEFAKLLGIVDGDLEKMRSEVRANLEREVKKRLQSQVKNQVMEAILGANPIEVPKALVDLEAQYMVENTKQDFKSRGMPTDNLPFEPAWFTPQASRRVKLGLLLAEVVKAKDLKAKPEQVRAVVDEFAATFEDPQEVVRWYYSQPQRLQEAESLATENNVVEWVLSVAKVKEKTVDFDELMGNAA
ncbi:MAG TPA: trigger factor [Rhodocyclaceae bacterium]|jgi:trigger factor